MSDLLSHGDDARPPWRPPTWRPPRWALSAAVVVVVGAVVAGVSVLAAGQGGRPHATASASPSTTDAAVLPVLAVAPHDPVGLLLPHMPGGTIETHDPGADRGPWTVTVRRRHSSFGRHGAVVTFPVTQSPTNRDVRVGDVEGHLTGNTLIWPVAGRYARVRGDMGVRELLAIARRTTTKNGRPVVDPPPGFRVFATGPYRPTEMTEARYGFHGDVAGLVSMGLITSGGFEDAVYAGPSVYPTTVRGRPAVATPILGGNFALVWEVRPGLVAYVGISGPPLSPTAVDALRKVAQRAQFVDAPRWRATNPRVRDQVIYLDAHA